MTLGKSQCTHVLSVDVEDYFHIEAFADRILKSDWDQWPCRVDRNTRRLLDLFDQYGAKATFFVLGWVAERFPALVREIHERGHELACHSYWHRCIYNLSPEEFRQDTRRALRVIEDASGSAVRGYRAPSWSITSQSMWALDILAEEGFEYDSSIYPITHDIYGIPGGQRHPYVHHLAQERTLKEFPPPTVSILGKTLPAAGGGYLRLLPIWVSHFAFNQAEGASQRVCVYLHPWEIDSDIPRIPGRLRSRFRTYTNLSKMEYKLCSLLSRYQFCSFADVICRPDNRAEPVV